MAGETTITITGNLVADPELRFTPSGAAVTKFTVASTPRTYDRQNNDWKDGNPLFLTCTVWRQTAENAAESLQKGMRVIVTGQLTQRSYETQQGEKRTVYEVNVDEIGPALKYAVAKVVRNERRANQQPRQQRQQNPGTSADQGPHPWETTPGTASPGAVTSWGTPAQEEPPF